MINNGNAISEIVWKVNERDKVFIIVLNGVWIGLSFLKSNQIKFIFAIPKRDERQKKWLF